MNTSILVESNAHYFPLLKLPIELRKKIYHICLFHDQPWYVSDRSPSTIMTDITNPAYVPREKRRQYDLAHARYTKARNITLLQVSRQIRTEVLPAFYGSNTFSFLTLDCLVPFLKDRTPDAMAAIKSIIITLSVSWDLEWPTYFRNLGIITQKMHLDRLIIRIDQIPNSNYPSEPDMSEISSWERLISLGIKDLPLAFNKVRNLGLVYNYLGPNADSMDFDDLYVPHWWDPKPTYKVKDLHDALWKLLAPDMMVVEGLEHTAEGLQCRRIL